MIELIKNLGPEIHSVLVSMLIATLRVSYDKKETRWQRVLLESLLCGSLTYGINSGLTYFDLAPGVSVFVGATVGFLGVDMIREFARRYVANKTRG